MFPIVRVGDTNAPGGIATAPRPTVLVQGVPLAQFASPSYFPSLLWCAWL